MLFLLFNSILISGIYFSCNYPSTNIPVLSFSLALSFTNGHFVCTALSGLYLCGHSAGAHLAAMVLSTDWSQYSVTPQIKGKVNQIKRMIYSMSHLH